MLIVDIKKEFPLHHESMDWNLDSIKVVDDCKAIVTIHDMSLNEVANAFAHEIAHAYPWQWPDLNRTTIALEADLSRSYPRFSLVVGTKPNMTPDKECGEEWTAFEQQRQTAIRENNGATVYDRFPVMLTASEENVIRKQLFDLLDLY